MAPFTATQHERAAAMAMKARKQAVGKAARGKAPARAAAGQMPSGAMTEPPKDAKARAMMPAGKMN